MINIKIREENVWEQMGDCLKKGMKSKERKKLKRKLDRQTDVMAYPE